MCICWQHYTTHTRFQPEFPISSFLFKYKRNSWDVEIFKFHLAVRQRKGLENSLSAEYDV